jgi:chemotaxis response regulator CheB
MQAAAPSVLTVEDDPTVRADLRLALEDAGFDVVAQADDEREAAELVREHQPDVVVLGPGVSPGRDEASERILAARRSIAIVELPRRISVPGVVEAVTGALAAHRTREIRDLREASLRSIETLVDHLSFATPPASELEQSSWERGHVWRRADTHKRHPE